MESCSEKFEKINVSRPKYEKPSIRKPSQRLYEKASLIQSSTVFSMITYYRNGYLTKKQINYIYKKLKLLKTLSQEYITSPTTTETEEREIKITMNNLKFALNIIETSIKKAKDA